MTENMASERLSMLFDDGEYLPVCETLSDSVFAGKGNVGGAPAVAFSQGGVFDDNHCNKIKKAFELAASTGCPVVGFYDSDGLELADYSKALASYSEMLRASSRLSGVVPQISVVCGACVGISAVTAGMADIVILVKDCDYYISASDGVTAEKSISSGAADIIADSLDDALDRVKSILSLLPANNLSPVPAFDSFEGDIREISDGQITIEIKKGYADSVSTALTTVNGISCGIIDYRNNALSAAAAYKAEAFVKLCDAYNLPIITLADNDGLERSDGEHLLIAATKLASAYTSATCPKISVIREKSIGAAHVILAGKGSGSDLTLACENAVISPLAVDAAAQFYCRDRLAEGVSAKDAETELSQTLLKSDKSPDVDCLFKDENMRSAVINALSAVLSKRETTLPRKHGVK